MPTFTSNLAVHFDSVIRSRGREYFRQGRVELLHADAEYVEARVLGSGNYQIVWFFNGNDVQVTCDCPYFASSESPCKHLWASALAIDQAKSAASAQRPKQVHARVAEAVDGEGMDDEDDEEEFGFDDDDFDDDETEDDSGWDDEPRRPAIPKRTWLLPTKPTKPKTLSNWWSEIAQSSRLARPPTPSFGSLTSHVFLLSTARKDARAARVEPCTSVRIRHVIQTMKKNGLPGAVRPARRAHREYDGPGRHVVTELCELLDGGERESRYWRDPFAGGFAFHDTTYDSWRVQSAAARHLLPALCASGLLHHESGDGSVGSSLTWDAESPFRLVLGVSPCEKKRIELSAWLVRGDVRIACADVLDVVRGGLALLRDRIVRFEPHEHAVWLSSIKNREDRTISRKNARKLIRSLFELPNAPDLDLHEEFAPDEEVGVPRPELHVEWKQEGTDRRTSDLLTAELVFNYDGHQVDHGAVERGWLDTKRWLALRRDPDSEAARVAELASLGLMLDPTTRRVAFETNRLPDVVKSLTAAGWSVRADQLRLRPPGELRLSVRSAGIDWFELRGRVDYRSSETDGANEVSASLPKLLEAVERGRDTVVLDDGTLGFIPEQWLKARRTLLASGITNKDTLRYTRTQTVLLDAILRTENGVDADAAFKKACDALRRGERPMAEEPGPRFEGSLRPYQKDGLGWMRHLRRIGLGGCLADDMGLGKTVQVLALLADGTAKRPTLVVAPRSVVFNWIAEAARFTPNLRVAAYLGAGRRAQLELVSKGGLLVTTYGTLRNDAALLETRFHLVVLDEAQAIKNRDTMTSRIARALKCDHRLALSGTPIENHFGEALSLFEFLNPGFLGPKARAAADSADDRPFVIRALRPFLLRRTKEQVATDLPTRTEQTVLCEMEGRQKHLYEELRDHYRDKVLARVATEGIQRARFHVLEALLRLRQAACHPALIEKSRATEPSAKLEALIPRLEEVVAEGHKALVFSQFTSFLALLKPRLDEAGLRYEYLDGKTRDREASVRRFQESSDCPLFLISLKAGGLGLNLTAAEYVFLLDPWWNPAVEAQAIDRAHRIGQTRPVFAYRLLTKDSVEERVAELQATKRKLFDSLMAETASLRDLDLDDLRRLLA